MRNLKQGDLVLIKTDHFVSKLIRLGQRGYGEPYASWNHVAIYVGEDEHGQDRIVEALTKGVQDNPLSRYKAEETKIIHVGCWFPGGEISHALPESLAMRYNAAEFAVSCVGEKYGFFTIFAIAIKTLTKGKFDFNIQGTSICSGLAARTLERMGWNFNPWDPAELTPAYLAKELT